MKNQKGFSALIGILIIVIVAVLAVAGYFVYKQYNSPKQQSQAPQNQNVNQVQTQNNSQQTVVQTNNTADWETYTSDNKYFSVQWPPSWTITTDGNYGIILSGKDGSLNIAWNGLGGACDTTYKKVITGEDLSYICDLKADGSYYSATIQKTTYPDVAIGIIPGVNGTPSDIFLKALKSIKLNSSAQILASAPKYKNDEYGFEFSYLTPDLCSGQGGSDAQGNMSLIDLCPSLLMGTISVSVKNQVIVNGVLPDTYFRNLDSSKVLQVGGKTAYRYSIDQDGCKGYLTAIPMQQNKTLEISFDNCGAGQVNALPDPNFPSDDLDFMNQFLSTFKFTN